MRQLIKPDCQNKFFFHFFHRDLCFYLFILFALNQVVPKIGSIKSDNSNIQTIQSRFQCEAWWCGVPTGRPLGGAAAVKRCTVRRPTDSLGGGGGELDQKPQRSEWGRSPDFRCWSPWCRHVPPSTWTPRISCANRAATPTACSASPWPCTGS